MSGLTIKVIYSDDDLVELRVRAETTTFAAQADVYALQGTCPDIARKLAGFPTGIGDVRAFQLGSDEPDIYAGGGASIRFVCNSGSGRSFVRIVVHTDPDRDVATPDSEPFTANFAFQIEPASVDIFVRQLGKMPATVQSAELKATL